MDHHELTGLRIHLPSPDCVVPVSECQDLEILNQLDGFNVQPRLSVPFDGPIDLSTVNSRSVFLLRLGPPQARENSRVGIDQIVWDPVGLTLHFQSDQMLDQHTRYALIVTNDVRDSHGLRVEESGLFAALRRNGASRYGRDVRKALVESREVGFSGDRIAAASVFTTESVTVALEQIRDQLVNLPCPPPISNCCRMGIGRCSGEPVEQVCFQSADRRATADAHPASCGHHRNLRQLRCEPVSLCNSHPER